MTTAARILKANAHHSTAQRVRLTELTESTSSRFTASDFEPLNFPTETTAMPDSATDERIESALAALHSAADQLQAQRDHWVDHCQQETVRIGIAIAERLLRRTLATRPDAVLDLVRSALECSVEAEQIRVRLHPADADLVTSLPDALLTFSRESGSELNVLADDSLARGDCVIETSHGQIDARQATLLDRIADELLAE
jgi:flagellar assembly protein FliH